jgi:hypothetical protein
MTVLTGWRTPPGAPPQPPAAAAASASAAATSPPRAAGPEGAVERRRAAVVPADPQAAALAQRPDRRVERPGGWRGLAWAMRSTRSSRQPSTSGAEPAAPQRAGRGVELLVPAGASPAGRVDERPARRRRSPGLTSLITARLFTGPAPSPSSTRAPRGPPTRAAAIAGRRTRARGRDGAGSAGVAGQAGGGRGLGGHDDRPGGHALPARELHLVRADPDDLRPEPDGAGEEPGASCSGIAPIPRRGLRSGPPGRTPGRTRRSARTRRARARG